MCKSQLMQRSASLALFFEFDLLPSIDTLASRPVLACGSEFIITRTQNVSIMNSSQLHYNSLSEQGVQCVISSADPDKTAKEIGKRLLNRYEKGA
jgi:hypothetical protein